MGPAGAKDRVATALAARALHNGERSDERTVAAALVRRHPPESRAESVLDARTNPAPERTRPEARRVGHAEVAAPA